MINIPQKKIFLILVLGILIVLASSIFWLVFGPIETQLLTPIPEEQKPKEELEVVEEEFKDKQPPTPTIPGFKTYRNEEWGFEFEYPELWIIESEYKSLTYYSKFFLEIVALVVVKINHQEEKIAHDPAFLVNIVLPEFIEGSFGNLEKTTSEITVAGVQGVKYQYKYQGFPHTAVILPFGELRIILATGDGSKQYLDEFNQILSTFKFLK